jgi:chitinase
MKKIYFFFLLSLITIVTNAQITGSALVGYWHNWNSTPPYIQLNQIDNRYNVIELAFAMPTSTSDMTMVFTPDVVTQSTLISQIQTLKSQGKKVLISIGGATAYIDLTTTANKNAFISSMTSIINTFDFDGIDIDIESGNSVLISGGITISNTTGDPAMTHLIDAIKQIMGTYKTQHAKKLFLTMAPETAYVQGGQSGFGSIWGGYLPIINALRDSLDILQVQLYNSGTMYGIDGNIYTQGTSDFIIAMTEAVIHGFNTSGGYFNGLPANKVAVGLPACTNAAGGGYVDTNTLKAAIKYLKGVGPKPGSYTLQQSGGYPTLKGLMTWSINWDAFSSCGGVYEFATAYQSLFTTITDVDISENFSAEYLVFPNPAEDEISINIPEDETLNSVEIFDISGKQLLQTNKQHQIDVNILNAGIYLVKIKTTNTVVSKTFIKK